MTERCHWLIALTEFLQTVEREAPVYLSRQEARALEDQAAGDWEFSDRMIERMEELARSHLRDAVAAVEALASASPLGESFEAFRPRALEVADQHLDRAGQYARRPLGFLADQLRRFAPPPMTAP